MQAIDLLNAEYVGVKELKDNLSKILHKKKLVITTDNGKPENVIVKFKVMVEILQLLHQLSNDKLSEILTSGRKSIKKGAPGIPALESLNKLK